MREDIRKEVLERLAEFKFVPGGDWLRKGKCPQCGAKELYTNGVSPWVLKCGRENKCGWDQHVKDRYSDIFDNWSNRFKPDDTNPTASADAYLIHARDFDLQGLRGHYSQENYVDRNSGLTSATVRFPLPGGGWWERLIDQPGRFDRKARFAPGKSYGGQWWTAPDHDLERLARADRIWITEGIFDALALRAAGEVSASAMTCNNYPKLALAELRRKIAELEIGGGPLLIFAFDVGKAGREYSIKFVKEAQEDGWQATAATVMPEGEGEKLDWNDLHQRKLLTPANLDEYLWHGEVMIAPSATEKACLIYDRKKWSSFSFVHDSRTWWASFNQARIAEVMATDGLSERGAARACANVDEIASCAFRILYFQTDVATNESHYYLRVDTPWGRQPAKAAFSTAAMAAGPEFKKRLLGVTGGAQWTGSTRQLEKIIETQKGKRGIREVETLDFTGYSRDHEAWVFGDIAVRHGRVQRINEEDYFDFGKMSLKLHTSERILSIDYDPDQLDTSWLPVIWTAFGTNGLIATTFWVMSFFAEQLRALHKSLPFLEATGLPGTGKSTLFEFLWKTAGRSDYEGFDPQKATSAAIARNLGKVANLPVVLLEGDRDDEKASHSRRFEWEELKTAYNGRSVRARGVRNGGNETYEPPFRGAIVIEQNNPVDASPAVLERIMQLHFDKAGFTNQTRLAAEKLEHWPVEDVSGFIIHLIRREADYLKAFRTAYATHEAEMNKRGKVSNGRIVKNHAQLAAGLDALKAVLDIAVNDKRDTIPTDARDETIERIYAMAVERRAALSADHIIVQKFWELFDYLELREHDVDPAHRINRHRKPDELIAVSLPHFEERCRARGLQAPSYDDLKRHLKSSKSRRFLRADTINAVDERSTHCWIFERPKSTARRSEHA